MFSGVRAPPTHWRHIMERKPTIYVAGPMRGFENYNYPAFDRCARVLRDQGCDVINPAELDRDCAKPTLTIIRIRSRQLLRGS